MANKQIKFCVNVLKTFKNFTTDRLLNVKNIYLIISLEFIIIRQ